MVGDLELSFGVVVDIIAECVDVGVGKYNLLSVI
jgi:hypothetical protein